MNFKIIKEVPEPRLGLVQFIKNNYLTVVIKRKLDYSKNIEFRFNVEGYQEEFMESWGKTIEQAIDLWFRLDTNFSILIQNQIFVFKEEELVKSAIQAYKNYT